MTQMGRAEAVAYGLFARCLKAEMGYFAGRPIAELRAHRERVTSCPHRSRA